MITVDEFFMAFYPTEQENIRLRFFPPRGGKGEAVKYGVTRLSMRNEETKSYLKRMNQSLGVYFVVNAGGDEDKDITRYNAFFIESDDKSIEAQHAALDRGPVLPSIRLQTSKSVHAYWLLQGDCTEAQWRDMQIRLIGFYEADGKNKNPSRVMRVPYFNHLKLEPDSSFTRTRIMLPHFDSASRFTVSHMQSAYPAPHKSQVEIRYSTGMYPNWDALNAEARRRILSQSGVQVHGEWAKCKGICHDGKSDTGLALNVASGAYFCQAGCETSHVLSALGLPAEPDAPKYSPPSNPQENGNSKEQPSQPKGIYTVDQLSERIDRLYEVGLLPGESPGWHGFEKLYTVKKGQFTILTGVPGSGKTQVLDNIMINLAKRSGWKFAVCSLENQPLEQHAATLMEMYTGQPFSEGPTPRMSVETKDKAKAWVNKFFTFLLPEENDCTITGLLELADAVRQLRGLDGLVIDPWNEFELRRPGLMTETQYTADILSRIRRFGRSHEVHTWLVAHPVKMTKDRDGQYPIPTLYDISGSAHFRNKADMGLVVWRDANDNRANTIVYVQKVRFRWCGQLGSIELKFNPTNGRYDEVVTETNGIVRMPPRYEREELEELA